MSNIHALLQQTASRVWQPQQYATVFGQCDERFARLKDDFARIQPSSGHAGSALTVFYAGKPVVNLHTGSQNNVKGECVSWQENTMALSWSCGKAVLATLIHVMVSEGMLDYDEPIATYWPAFSKNGKQHITLRHVMCHESGLFSIRCISSHANDLLDWQGMLERVEAMSPVHPVGQHVVYHAVTYGYILGGLVEKVTGSSLQTVLNEKLLMPLGIENDFYFGVPDRELPRVARVIDRDKPARSAHSAHPQKKHSLLNQQAIKRAITPVLKTGYQAINDLRGIQSSYYAKALLPHDIASLDFSSDEVLQCCAPAFNGVFTTKAMATIYAMLANRGEWQGKRLISEHAFATATRLQNHEVDHVFSMGMKWRLGYHKALTLGKMAPDAFGHSGYNGSMSFCDPSRQLAFSYIHNFKNVVLATDLRLNYLSQQALRLVDAL